MGKQSPARDRHWRWHWLGNDAERLGSDLAHPETAHSMDARQRRQRHTHARQSEIYGPASVSMLPRQCLPVDPIAVLHGRSQPLSDVREINLAKKLGAQKTGGSKE